MAKHINLVAVSTYIATAAPGQLGVLRDICLARAERLGVTAANAKKLPSPQQGVSHVTLKVAGFKAWAEGVESGDKQAVADLASVLAALNSRLGM